MLEEAAVLDGEDGVEHVGGNLIVGDDAALDAVFIFGERGDELRLELVGGEGCAVVGDDGLDDGVGGAAEGGRGGGG